MKSCTWIAVAAFASGGTNLALAHGDMAHDAKKPAVAGKEQMPWGIAGNPKQVDRTIRVEMHDTMRFSPDQFRVHQGETIRFIHRNSGKVVHEFVLGTKAALDEHAALMVKFPNMEHDEPYMIHVAAGKTGEIVWTFNRAGTFDFACLIPGHYQAGMVGKVVVEPK
jgi:uncharacterized cupredoxin-like copper-binding protein